MRIFTFELRFVLSLILMLFHIPVPVHSDLPLSPSENKSSEDWLSKAIFLFHLLFLGKLSYASSWKANLWAVNTFSQTYVSFFNRRGIDSFSLLQSRVRFVSFMVDSDFCAI
jgi:hypothetical protein